MEHLVKVGLMGLVGRYRAVDLRAYTRNAKVICRTKRGLEIGHVLCSLDESDLATDQFQNSDGDLLRTVGNEDQLILERLDRYRDRAYMACSRLLNERKLPGVLVDVEHLFDGESLYFYFLGDVDPRVEALTSELAETYERKVRFKKFAETLAQGCGPECGTGVSCGTSEGCKTCALGGG